MTYSKGYEAFNANSPFNSDASSEWMRGWSDALSNSYINEELTTITEPVGFHGGNVKYSDAELASEARRVAYARKLIETYSRKGRL